MPTDAETLELAAAIAGSSTLGEAIVENRDGSVTREGLLGQEPVPTPTTSQGDASAAPLDDPSQGDEEKDADPAPKPLESTEEPTLESLLNHPKLGPILNSWADRAAAAQVTTALQRERTTITSAARAEVEEKAFEEELSRMSHEDLSQEIANDPKFASAYARYQERKSRPPEPDPEAIAMGAQVYAYTAQVATYSRALEESSLPADVKATLDPKNFTGQGPDGIVSWGQAIFDAMVKHESSKALTTELDSKWEAYKQEHLAELDGNPPPIVSGRRSIGMPDLMGIDSSVLLETALSKQANK